MVRSNLFMIKNLLKSYQTVLKNFSALSLLQLLQLSFSFLTYPYLISVLGMEKYGVIAYSQVLVAYMSLVVNYGFNATATKEISINRDDLDKISEIIRDVFFCRFFLMIFVLLVYCVVIFSFSFFENYIWVYLCMGISIFGVWLFPEWYFQGVEKMENITYATLISRLISIIAIFCMIKSKEDLLMVAIIYSLSTIISGIIGYYLLLKSHPLSNFFKIKFRNIKLKLIDGFSYFFSNFVASSKENLSIIIIGGFLNFESVAIYDFAKKVVNILAIPSGMATRALFPTVVRKRSLGFNFKVEKILLAYSLFAVFLIFFIPDAIWSYVIQKDLQVFKQTIYILILSLPLYVLCGTRGFLTLIGLGYDKEFSRNIFLSVIAYIIFLIFLLSINLVSTLACSFVIVLGLIVEVLLHQKSVKNIDKKV